MSFIVWVGGVPDYEGDSLATAKAVFNEWVSRGFDDVILETVHS